MSGFLRTSSSLDDVVEHLVLDLDRPQGVLGVLLGVGGDGDDLVAGEEQFAADRVLLDLDRDRVARLQVGELHDLVLADDGDVRRRP